MRRENYKLKQEALKSEEVHEEAATLKGELAGIHELYALKCRETDLLQRKLEEVQEHLEQVLTDREEFKDKSVEYFKKLLSGQWWYTISEL